MTDIHEWFDRIGLEKTNASWEALDKALHGAGSDLAFVTAFELADYLNKLVTSPRDIARYDALGSDVKRKAA